MAMLFSDYVISSVTNKAYHFKQFLVGIYQTIYWYVTSLVDKKLKHFLKINDNWERIGFASCYPAFRWGSCNSNQIQGD